MIGLYLITAKPSTYRPDDFRPADVLARMRRARGSDGGRVHLTTALQPKIGAQVSLCGGYPSPLRRGLGCDPRKSKPWQWTDDDIDCRKCLALIVEKVENGALVFATPQQAGELVTQLTRVHPVSKPRPLTARERALQAGMKPNYRAAKAFGWVGDGAAGAAEDAWHSTGRPSLASIALAELRENDHYPFCDLDEDNDEPQNNGRCSCYGDEFLA